MRVTHGAQRLQQLLEPGPTARLLDYRCVPARRPPTEPLLPSTVFARQLSAALPRQAQRAGGGKERRLRQCGGHVQLKWAWVGACLRRLVVVSVMLSTGAARYLQSGAGGMRSMWAIQDGACLHGACGRCAPGPIGGFG